MNEIVHVSKHNGTIRIVRTFNYQEGKNEIVIENTYPDKDGVIIVIPYDCQKVRNNAFEKLKDFEMALTTLISIKLLKKGNESKGKSKNNNYSINRIK